MKITQLLVISLFLTLLAACTSNESSETKTDKVLATVYTKNLYLSELEGMVPDGSTPEDSIMLVNAYVERWVRESLLMHEAEKNIPKDLHIDELVRDYRASLIRHNYEKLVIELQLDSTITDQQLKEYYETNKEQYKLEDPIIRCQFIKLPVNSPDADSRDSWWKNPNDENFKKLLDYCSKFATMYMLDDSTWYKAPEIFSQMPKGMISENNLQAKRDYSFSDDQFRYLLRVNEVVQKNTLPPMSYVSDQASKVILHQRRLKLLETKKEEMYERETRKNNIQIFTQ